MIKIQLGGVEYTLTFNMGFLRLFYKEYNIDPLNLSGVQLFDLAYAVIYCGLITTYKINGEKLPFEKERVEDLIDQLHPEDITPVITAFTTWMSTPKSTVKEEAQEGGNFQ